jgi:hypothetical protein
VDAHPRTHKENAGVSFRNTAVAQANIKMARERNVPLVDGLGTRVAKEPGMLTVSTFVLAIGSVVSSVLWACRGEMSGQA